MRRLRRWRRAELTRIAWRDLAGIADLPAILLELSNAADAGLRAAQRFAELTLAPRHGWPRDAGGAIVPMVIVAMGKLGGRELNFSSDVDLIFLYAAGGETDGNLSLANEEYFTRLGQLIIRQLDTQTADGFVYRVDMRLRPFGDSGALVSSFAALEDYLQAHGRDWERYAWIKARAVTNAAAYLPLFRDVIRPFVYRRFLDFGVFESLREMKALIERDVARRERRNNIKLGRGGIREIEFAVQTLQLVRGGADRALQDSSLLATLPKLVGGRLLSAAAAAQLRSNYEFLRRLENRLQMRADLQVHQLPQSAREQADLAFAMGFKRWAALLKELDAHRKQVAAQFGALAFGATNNDEHKSESTLALWAAAETTDEELTRTLSSLRVVDPQSVAATLRELALSAQMRRLEEVGQRRLVQLVATLLREVAATHGSASHPQVPSRLLRVVEAIGLRSSYFSLLLENARARARLINLVTHGEFVAQQIARYPILLDELIDTSLEDALPDRAALVAELDAQLSRVDEHDEEQRLDQLRHFQHIAHFRVAAADIAGRLPLMRVSDRLTEIAEVLLEKALCLAAWHLSPQLGQPMCGIGRRRRPVRIAAVGYGKLGGQELGYSSDLDLVFLHDSTGDAQHTSGVKPVDNQIYFVRFVQRLVHALSFHSAAGRLYDIDMRLRPSGKGGLLITSVDAFAEYQRSEAWTWEHQALLHARAVAGDESVRARFDAVRTELVCRSRVAASLRSEVAEMRQRRVEQLSEAGEGECDLKHDAGGIGDIEFLAQYWVLRWAHAQPPLGMFADTIRQLESVASANLRPQREIDVLTGAYRHFRALLHRRSLDGLGSVVPAAEVAKQRAAVAALWAAEMELAPLR